MTRFKIISSRPTGDLDIADFDIIYFEGMLASGESFIVYDTYHPRTCHVIGIYAGENITTLRCELHLGLGWEDQFAGAIIDTDAKGKPAAFRYDHENKKL
jgi:hypothetical protein